MSDDKKQSPLESIFDIEPGSTPVFTEGLCTDGFLNERATTLVDPTTGETVNRSSSPDLNEVTKEERLEDLHIDQQLESIHSHAIVAFEKSSRMADEVDPKFAARNAEVAAQYLNLALNAVSLRVEAKYKRQKVRLAANKESQNSGIPNNGVVLVDRNALLRQLLNTGETYDQ